MRDVLTSLFSDEHTGDRRCWPCTATNLALLAAATAVATAVWWPGALALGVVGVAAILFRGYLVPGTPRFAPALAAFLLPGDGQYGGDPPAKSDALGGDVDGERVLAGLLDAAVLREDEDGLYLDEAFRERWRDEMAATREGDLADAVRELAPEGVERVEQVTVEDDWLILSDGTGAVEAETWLTHHVAIAEVAAARALADRDPDLPREMRVAAATPLRAFLLECPVCDGPVERTTGGCCCGGSTDPEGPAEDDILACRACDQRLYTF